MNQPNLLQRIGAGITFGLASLIGTAKADVSMATKIYEKDTNVPVAKVMVGKPYDLRVEVDTTTMPTTQFKEAKWQPAYRDSEGNALNQNEAYFVDSAEPRAYNVFLINDYFESATMWNIPDLNKVDTDFSTYDNRNAASNYPSNRNRPVANYVFRVDASRIGATDEMFDFARSWVGTATCRVTDSAFNQYAESRYSPYHLNVSGATFDVVRQGDINGDGKVNVFDLQRFGAAWNSKTGDANYDPVSDLNADGIINVFDLQKLGANWNKSI